MQTKVLPVRRQQVDLPARGEALQAGELNDILDELKVYLRKWFYCRQEALAA